MNHNQLSFRIALRYLFAKKSHSAVNVISMVSVAGVAVATIAMVCVMSVFNGFADLAGSRLSVADPDIRITPRSGKVIADADSVVTALAGLDVVAEALPVIQEQALAVYHDAQMPVTVKGVPDGYAKVSRLATAIIDGEMRSPDSLGVYTTLSVGVAMKLGARPSFYDPLAIYVPRRRGRYNPANPMTGFRSDSLIVSGVYEIDQPEYDKDIVVVPLDVARALLDYDSEASAVEVALRRGAGTEAAVERIASVLGPEYQVADRQRQQEDSFRMINIEKWITLLMLAFILVIASFNIVSTLTMLIVEKRDSTAIMHALGAPESMTGRIFFFEGWLISLVGGAAGIVAGVALVLAQQWGGFIKLAGNAAQLSIQAYPVRLAGGDLIIIFAIVAVIGFLTGLIGLRRR